MLDAAGLIRKHKGRGVLVDAHLLVLFLVGLVNRRRVETFKRTQSFSQDDFDLVNGLIKHFGPPLVATPHVLSQVSDLTDLKGPELTKVRDILKRLIVKADEHYDPAADLASQPVFKSLGLADAGIVAAKSRGVLILTADFRLHEALENQGVDALNFNHARQLAWRREL